MNNGFPKIEDLDQYLGYIKYNWSKTYPNGNLNDAMNTFSTYAQTIIMETNFNFNKTYVKTSAINGNGIFALHPIKKYEVFTIYPSHYILKQIDKTALDISYSTIDLAIECIYSQIVQLNGLSLTFNRLVHLHQVIP